MLYIYNKNYILFPEVLFNQYHKFQKLSTIVRVPNIVLNIIYFERVAFADLKINIFGIILDLLKGLFFLYIYNIGIN